MKRKSPRLAVALLGALAAGVVYAGVALTSHPSSAGSGFEAHTSDASGVRVVVTPRPIAAGDKWEFEVAMDTHVKPLAEGLAAVSVLVDDNGQRSLPTAWLGDPPGGHHRKGVLQFAAPATPPKSFELQLTNVGGAALRTFRWEMK